MKYWAPLPLVWALLTSEVWASDLMPFVAADHVGAVLKNVSLPDSLPRELKSGLTTRLLLRLTVTSDSRILVQQALEIAVRYDLWEERFTVTTTTRGVAQTLTNQTPVQVSALLAELRAPDLLNVSALPIHQPIVIRADILVNPISQERMKQLSKWVAENSTPVELSTPAGAGSNVAPSPFSSAAVLNRLIDQYATGAAESSLWHTAVSSRPFTREELRVGP